MYESKKALGTSCRRPAWLPLGALLSGALPLALLLSCGVPKDKHEAATKEAADLKKKLDRSKEQVKGLEKAVISAQKRTAEVDEKVKDAQAAQEAQTKAVAAQLKASEQEVAALTKARQDAEEQGKLLQLITGKLDTLVKERHVSLGLVHGRMVIKLRSQVLFASGSAALLPAGEKALTQVAKVLADVKGSHFQVAGHTDNVAIKKGDFADNWELSTARALTVLKFLKEQGVAGESLSAAGFSEFQPVARNKTKWGRQMNRRIEITLLPRLPREVLDGPSPGAKEGGTWGRKGRRGN